MQEISITTIDELVRFFDSLEGEYVFRGQSKHYTVDKEPSLKPSFWTNGGPSGCNMPLRHRWSHYSNFIIYAILGHHNFDDSLPEAILQHYGWQSFFLDISSSPQVAAWFSANVYHQNIQVHLSEDCWEKPVWLCNKTARYETNPNQGNLYVISKQKLLDHEYKILDLAILRTAEGKSRPDVQKALLTGPFSSEALPSDCVAYHISAPAEIFCDFAKNGGLSSIEDIFPSPAQDPIYRELLSNPWININAPESMDGMTFFRRFLEIPDYYNGYRKRLPSNIAFYWGFSLYDAFIEHGEPYKNPCFFPQTPDFLIFSTGEAKINNLTEILQLLSQWDTIIFELDMIAPRPEIDNSTEYVKGLSVKKTEDGIICISDATIEQTGTETHGCGANCGWHYTLDKKGKYQRIKHKEDCPCLNNFRHQHHLEALKRIESHLQKIGYHQISERAYNFRDASQ